MSTSDRERAESLLDEIERRTVSGPEEDPQRFGLITKMLMAYPIANATAATGAARGEAYREALNDIPPAALDAAIKRWHRGECGEDHDYRWAPAPAVLRTICLQSTEPLRLAGHDLRTLLSAITLERAMDPRPIESESRTSALRRIA